MRKCDRFYVRIEWGRGRDLSVILIVLLVVGFAVWWLVAPEVLLDKPGLLCSPDLQTTVKIARDTARTIFHLHVNVVSLVARLQDLPYDPIEEGKKGVALCIATVILSIALPESISVEDGIRLI